MSDNNLRRGTETASFGTGARESHDSSAFYARFVPPEITDDETVVHPDDRPYVDTLFHGTTESLLADDTLVRDNSVALVVTSPPYFVGKDYEEAMGLGHVPAEYGEHLEILHQVFKVCVDKLEPGGRIAVNVANLGRKPYRSQAADVVRIFEDLGLLMRGEIIWKKGDGMNSSTAWGSFQRASNPVLRDLTERIIVASKGRFDRAVTARRRHELGLPCRGSISKEEFMSATKDVWELPSESATRVGHPAPFPVELPQRLIDLYTYYDDLILDPFMGAGTAAVAAVRTGRRYVGCETEPEYLAIAEARIADERRRVDARLVGPDREPVGVAPRVVVPAFKGDPGPDHANGAAGGAQVVDADLASAREAVRAGQKAEVVAGLVLEACGFRAIQDRSKQLTCGVPIGLIAESADGQVWHFDVTGSFTAERDGLRRGDTLWKALGRAGVRSCDPQASDIPYVLLTTTRPPSGALLRTLQAAQQGHRPIVFDAIELLSAEGHHRLRTYASGGRNALETTPDPIGPAGADASN